LQNPTLSHDEQDTNNHYGMQLHQNLHPLLIKIPFAAMQLVGLVCRVSCATPVLGPCMGLVGVGLANALAGQASRHTRKLLTKGGNPLDKSFWDPVDIDDVVLDAVLGICIFKVGNFLFSGGTSSPWAH